MQLATRGARRAELWHKMQAILCVIMEQRLSPEEEPIAKADVLHLGSLLARPDSKLVTADASLPRLLVQAFGEVIEQEPPTLTEVAAIADAYYKVGYMDELHIDRLISYMSS